MEWATRRKNDETNVRALQNLNFEQQRQRGWDITHLFRKSKK